MNQTIQDLKERRSVRAYQAQQIKDEELEVILEVGAYAATGQGKQSPVIVAVQDPQTIFKLSKLNAQVLGNPNMDPFYGAPTVVVVLADKAIPTYIEDGSVVIGNLMNAAHAVGVDSCWIHRAKEVFESEEGKLLLKEWGINGDYAGVGHCILGYREGDYPQAKERKSGYITIIK